MKTVLLDRDDYLLLRQIVRFRNPNLLPLLETGSIFSLAADDLLAIRSVIEAEVLEYGRGDGDAPNHKGRILDDLLQMIGCQ